MNPKKKLAGLHTKLLGNNQRVMRVSGQKVRALRIEECMTQVELAQAAKLTPKFISKVENNDDWRLMATVKKLGRALHVKIAELQVDEEEAAEA